MASNPHRDGGSWQVSKGSAPRPIPDRAGYEANFDAIFRVGRSSTAEQAALTGPAEGSNPSAPATYIDDATGQVVDETWWPESTANGLPPTNRGTSNGNA